MDLFERGKVSAVVTKLDEIVDSSSADTSLIEKESAASSKNLIFGSLNLFSDGVGLTTGGFIYVAVGVIAEMNGSGSLTLKNPLIQLTSLVLGMGVALGISIVE